MIVPKPPAKLEGHCSVIHENTLYTYSSNGFASIPLERNGTWSQLTTNGAELVSDAVCIKGGVDGNESRQALYVVGGLSSNPDATGLQRYSFKDKKWKAIDLPVDSLVNRTAHSAVYLKALSKILIYGGSTTDASRESADTFYVSTKPDYVLDSGSGANVSAMISPILLPWSNKVAALFGRQSTSNGMHLWDSDQGWHKSGYPDLNVDFSTATKCALIPQSDGDQILQTFDITASPVNVTTFLLSAGQAQSSRKRKRDNFPKYDGTLAPTATKAGYSIAQSDDSDNQLVVISGGSGTDSLSIFNQTSNSWVNSTKLFYGDKSKQDILGSTTTTSPQPTATASESSTPSGSSSNDSGSNVGTILGATIGSLMGVALILVLLLFFIKRKKEKMKRGGDMDKDRLSFQDRGVEPLTRSAYPMAQSPVPRAAASMDSLDIFSGNMGDEKSPRPAGSIPPYMQKSQPPRPSPLNKIQTSGAWDDKAIEAGQSPARPGDRTTDEIWGKYFQDDNTTPTLINLQSPHESMRDSQATIWPANHNALPRLDMNFLQKPTPLGRVNTGSPTTEFATSVRDGRQIAIPESQSARISSADTASICSDDDDPDQYQGVREHSWLGRPPSSTYSRSFYNPHSSTRDVPSTAAPLTVDYRKHDSGRTNTRGSSILIPDGQPLPRTNVNSDMSWLNLNANR
ncbi:hypothetical protein BJX76DRAFT_76489 [Aspergillus varians]